MPNLKEVRNRIASVKSTQQITSAMKLVAASKLRRAQNAILAMRPYASKLQELLQALSGSLDQMDGSTYTDDRGEDKVLLIAITSNKGLCGAFNSHVIKRVKHALEHEFKEQYKSGNLNLFFFGKKALDHFTKRKYKNVNGDTALLDNLTFENTLPFAQNFMNAFSDQKHDKIIIIYNQFKNAAVQKLVTEQYLPIIPPEGGEEHAIKSDFIFEPGKQEIIRELIPKSLKIQLYKALLDSYASEQGARMTAMHNATDNARELVKELQLKYNKARQSAITNELIEIVSGAEALRG
ncbi:MAG: ATP synthase F1 subunit gamma [Bacteroidales bacterium]|nr:ATP synthase F1 subunit gamma [Bacteroidales bacterium]MCF8345471.1 ATP synthase F1 subunit gamma [Bacteroidales bacterium]MCF8350093.1 ATP synthase F1 subunit gamma [Bacteroidales bacterium]MCF8376151.1 ATP synthase F1 subunit gamma [Bacteroidales bacterium]